MLRRAASAALLILGTGPAAADMLLFAAASTTTAMEEVMDVFARRGLGAVRASFAGSSALAQQIANGAPADIFVSANRQWMDFLSRQKAIVTTSRVDLLGNRLVLVVPDAAPPPAGNASAFPLARASMAGSSMGMPVSSMPAKKSAKTPRKVRTHASTNRDPMREAVEATCCEKAIWPCSRALLSLIEVGFSVLPSLSDMSSQNYEIRELAHDGGEGND